MKKKCINCNEVGHIYKNCKSPLSSYGIIICRCLEEQEFQYLMIQRRHTFGYVEIIRTNFQPHDEHYVAKLMSEMTRTERENIVAKSFDDLWDDLWLQTQEESARYSKDFRKCKAKFESCVPMFERLHRTIPCLWETPEWGFPKGKRNVDEDFVSCAVREVFEETNIDRHHYEVVEELSPLEETFRGTDNRIYRHLYLVARLTKEDIVLEIQQDNLLQRREVGDIRWLSLTDALVNIRPYNLEKISLLKFVDQSLCAGDALGMATTATSSKAT